MKLLKIASKRGLALLVTLMMCLSLLPGTASATNVVPVEEVGANYAMMCLDDSQLGGSQTGSKTLQNGATQAIFQTAPLYDLNNYGIVCPDSFKYKVKNVYDPNGIISTISGSSYWDSNRYGQSTGFQTTVTTDGKTNGTATIQILLYYYIEDLDGVSPYILGLNASGYLNGWFGRYLTYTVTQTHTHNYVNWTDNGNGTHTGTCNCGDTQTENHVDANNDNVCDKCGAKDTPVAPEAPKKENLYGIMRNFVNVHCTNTSAKHADKQYSTVNDKNDVSIGEVTPDSNGYTCDVTVNGAAYAEFYGYEPIFGTGEDHTLAAGEGATKTITLRWNAEAEKWVPASTVPVTFNVTCQTETKYTVTYTDGVSGKTLFPDQSYEDLSEGDDTPEFVGTPTRAGYDFKDWTPKLAATVKAESVNAPEFEGQSQILYTATWKCDGYHEDTNGDGLCDRDGCGAIVDGIAPDADTAATLIGSVTVKCTNENRTHNLASKDYTLTASDITSIGTPTEVNGAVVCDVTISHDNAISQFVADPNNGTAHTPTTGSQTVRLTYGNHQWTAAAAADINVACDTQQTGCDHANYDHHCEHDASVCGNEHCKGREHVDNDDPKDHICDICGGEMPGNTGSTGHTHTDNGTGHCSDCGACMHTHEGGYCTEPGCTGTGNHADCCVQRPTGCDHVDADKDHKCDNCDQYMGEHKDGDNDHKCDYCGEIMSDHEDENGDHKCDICDKDMPGATVPETYTVTFCPALGAWNGDAHDRVVEVNDDGTVTAPATNPTREGYTFSGWKDANGKEIPGKIEASMTVYAQWTEVAKEAHLTAAHRAINASSERLANGDSVVFQIILTNTGTEPLYNMTLEEVMDPVLQLDGQVQVLGSNQTLTNALNSYHESTTNNSVWWQLSGLVLNPNESFFITYNAKLKDGAQVPDRAIQNNLRFRFVGLDGKEQLSSSDVGGKVTLFGDTAGSGSRQTKSAGMSQLLSMNFYSAGDGPDWGGEVPDDIPVEIPPQQPPQHTHSYTSTVTKTPTCTETGTRTYTCSCGDSYTEDIPATGHNYVSSDTPATCTTAGQTGGQRCSKCGDEQPGTIVPALGHNMGEWYSIGENQERHDCSRCDYYETRDVTPENPGDGGDQGGDQGGGTTDPGDTTDPGTPDPTPTPIPDDPTPTTPAPAEDNGEDIGDESVPLAGIPGLNSADHFAYILGYTDGTVRPEANIKRAEVATIFFRLMTDDYRSANWSTSSGFSDVTAGAWYNNAVSTSVKAGLVKGYTNGTFAPEANITRAEFATLAARFLGDDVTGDNVGDFADTVGHWAARDIRRAAEAGWITGEGNKFRPDDPITRAEVVMVINRMLDRAPDAEHLLDGMTHWSDNPVGTWYYADIQEATNSHAYDRSGVSASEVWTAIEAIRDWSTLEAEWAANGGASAK